MKKVLLVSVGILISAAVLAQYNSSTRKSSSSNSGSGLSLKDRLYFSGGGGLGGGTNPQNGFRYSYFSLLPSIGYKVTPEFLVGLNVYYSKYNFPDQGISYEQIGFAPFVRYYIQQLFFQAEYDMIQTPTINYTTGAPESKKFYDRFLVGVGYKQPLGNRSAVNVMALYDLLYQPNSSPFLTPFVYRVFFSF